MTKTRLNVAIADLKKFHHNPKKHDIGLITKSIKELGFIDDVVISEDNTILSGHGRIEALRKLGKAEVEAIKVSGWTEEQKRKYLLASNQSVILGGFDNDELKLFEKDELEFAGFDSTRFFDVEEDDFDAEKEYEAIKETKSQLGDLYELSGHRLICGDAQVDSVLEKLTTGHVARLIFTDPPYNVDYKSPGGLSYDSKKFGGTGEKIFNDNKSDEECLNFYTEVLKNLYQYSTDDCTIYWWFADKNNWMNREAFTRGGWHISQIIIWLKNSMIFSRGQDYHRRYEPCMVGWKKKKSHYKDKKIGNLQDCFNLDFTDFNDMFDVWYEKRDITRNYVHPTQRPVRLAERALKKNSQENDIVMDVFGGSGSTLLACEQLNRKAYLCELDPKYCDVIVSRYCQFTGNYNIKLNGEPIEWKS